MRHASFLLACLLLMSCHTETDTRKEAIDTPDGQITTTVTTVEPIPQRVDLATPDDVERFRSNAAQARKFASTYVTVGDNVELKALDEAFSRWQRQSSPAFTRQQVVDVLGSALGEKLVADLDMEWVVVSDESGADYAVRSKKSEVMAYPFSSVQKRIDRNEYDFLVGIYHSVRTMIEGGEYQLRDKRK